MINDGIETTSDQLYNYLVKEVYQIVNFLN